MLNAMNIIHNAAHDAATMRPHPSLQRLELMECAATPTTLEVAWVAPTKNAHKLRGFKLMMTDRDGGAKEVYEVCAFAWGLQLVMGGKGMRD